MSRYAGAPLYGPEPPPERTVPGRAEPVPPASSPPAEQREHTVPVLLVAGGLLVALAVLGMVGFLAPGYLAPRTLDQVAVQDGVRATLTGRYALPDVAQVHCPVGQPVRAGRGFDCAVTVAGRSTTVTVRVLDPSGAYEVARPK